MKATNLEIALKIGCYVFLFLAIIFYILGAIISLLYKTFHWTLNAGFVSTFAGLACLYFYKALLSIRTKNKSS